MADAESLKADIADIKAELRLMSRTLQQIAVQEEKIQSIRRCQEENQEAFKDIYSRLNSLQSDHDSCSVGKNRDTRGMDQVDHHGAHGVHGRDAFFSVRTFDERKRECSKTARAP